MIALKGTTDSWSPTRWKDFAFEWIMKDVSVPEEGRHGSESS